MTERNFKISTFLIAAMFIGLVSSASANSLKKYQTASLNSESNSEFEVFNEELVCLALNIYFEARSEPVDGMLAVGHVVMNRVAHRNFPDTVCEVIRQGGEVVRHRCQFSWWCDGRSDRPRNAAAWDAARLVAWFVYNGHTEDPTAGALWYHAEYVAPYWRTAFLRGPQIGRHIFYRASIKKSSG